MRSDSGAFHWQMQRGLASAAVNYNLSAGPIPAAWGNAQAPVAMCASIRLLSNKIA
jgi:hypothetical protein